MASPADELPLDDEQIGGDAHDPGQVPLSDETIEVVVAAEAVGKRLDAFLADQFPHFSRMLLRRAIHSGGAFVEGKQVRAAFKLRLGQCIRVRLPEPPQDGPIPEDIPLHILYEDEHLAAINKPAGMVVHPGRGNWKGTLTSALAHHFQSLSDVGGPVRPGVVHRLDRDTTGVIVVAKTNRAHFALAQQFEERTTEKEYLAIVVGTPNHDRDVIELPIGVHPYQREKMAIRANHSTSKPARTFYEVLEKFAGFALVLAKPKTGRTHQIRVHLTHVGHPILCDRLYGGRATLTRGELTRDASDSTLLLDRQALHAFRLRISHPMTGQPLEFEAPLPDDMLRTLEALRTLRRTMT
ncbi:MAG: RluA family pseudouridine synthase [Pirellulales bacterium]